jgi:hypothetical protein
VVNPAYIASSGTHNSLSNFELIKIIFNNNNNNNEKNEMSGACSTYRERRGLYRVLVGKPGGKRPLGRHRLR